MASKASMLKNGAKKTGSGLFAGMSPINEEKEEKAAEAEVQETKEELTPEPEARQIQQAPVQEPPATLPTQQPEAKPAEPASVELTTDTTAKSKNSRYEKEKFLLLDIRGLRDYVEHMAKASNTSATKYIRNLIELDMRQNMDIYEAHKALEEKLRGRRE